MTKVFSEYLKLNLLDWGKGFILTLVGAAVSTLESIIVDKHLPTTLDLKNALAAGLTAGIAYLLHKLVSAVPKTIEIDPSKTTVINTDTKEVINANEVLSSKVFVPTIEPEPKVEIKVEKPVVNIIESKPEETYKPNLGTIVAPAFSTEPS